MAQLYRLIFVAVLIYFCESFENVNVYLTDNKKYTELTTSSTYSSDNHESNQSGPLTTSVALIRQLTTPTVSASSVAGDLPHTMPNDEQKTTSMTMRNIIPMNMTNSEMINSSHVDNKAIISRVILRKTYNQRVTEIAENNRISLLGETVTRQSSDLVGEVFIDKTQSSPDYSVMDEDKKQTSLTDSFDKVAVISPVGDVFENSLTSSNIVEKFVEDVMNKTAQRNLVFKESFDDAEGEVGLYEESLAGRSIAKDSSDNDSDTVRTYQTEAEQIDIGLSNDEQDNDANQYAPEPKSWRAKMAADDSDVNSHGIAPRQGALGKWNDFEPRDFPERSGPMDLASLKADSELLTRLVEYLTKFGVQLPLSLIARVDETDLCPDNALEGMRYYCMKMDDGQYHDPWNPYCGFIECSGGRAKRLCCRTGTWMGTNGSLRDRRHEGAGLESLVSKKDICRRPLRRKILSQICPQRTAFQLCKATKTVEAYNIVRKVN